MCEQRCSTALHAADGPPFTFISRMNFPLRSSASYINAGLDCRQQCWERRFEMPAVSRVLGGMCVTVVPFFLRVSLAACARGFAKSDHALMLLSSTWASMLVLFSMFSRAKLISIGRFIRRHVGGPELNSLCADVGVITRAGEIPGDSARFLAAT